METLIFSKNQMDEAVALLKKGELIAFPTETVYGLAAPIFSEETIKKIFTVKSRPQDNPLIAHIASISQVHEIACEIPHTFYQLADVFFPGPLALIVKKSSRVPEIVTADLDTIAIRMPDHEIARELITLLGEPIVAPSANISGKPSSTQAKHVFDDFSGKIAGIIDGGPCLHGIESTVIDLVSFEKPTLMRYGAIKKEEIEKVLGYAIESYSKGVHSSPGMKYRHYSPKARVYYFTEYSSFHSHLEKKQNALIISSENIPYPSFPLEGQSFYATLRLADEHCYDEVVIFSKTCNDAALLSRLEKIVHEGNSNQ